MRAYSVGQAEIREHNVAHLRNGKDAQVLDVISLSNFALSGASKGTV